MESFLIFLRKVITFSLTRDNMEQAKLIQFQDILNRFNERHYIVSIYRAKVAKSQLLKHQARDDQVFQALKGVICQFSDSREPPKLSLHLRTNSIVQRIRDYRVQIFADTTHKIGRAHVST